MRVRVRDEQSKSCTTIKEVERQRDKGIRRRKPGSDLGLYMFRSLTPHVKWVGPALLSGGLEFAFLSAP